jgi:hypothetical protein
VPEPQVSVHAASQPSLRAALPSSHSSCTPSATALPHTLWITVMLTVLGVELAAPSDAAYVKLSLPVKPSAGV